jgi:transcriptional regulator with GAF, ATPase, and Fis domain
VLPHDTMGLAILDEDGLHARLYAVSTDVDFERPEKIALNDQERQLISDRAGFEVVDDIVLDPAWQGRPPSRIGLRAMIRVPVDLGDVTKGGLSVFSRQAGAFTTADVPVLQRVAEYVSLALSHQRLAEEAARAAEARERAQRLERRVEALTEELEARSAPEGRIIGQSSAWRAVLEAASRVAPTGATVLLTGESGTGKELVARLIHRESGRSRGPFVAVNCAALPEPLLESEMFGAERGAFTGAVQSRPGRLEQAAGGTLFLDEVAEMSPAIQAKLLRVLQEREFQRLGGQKAIRADVRVVAATNRDLRQLVATGGFREDLFYRLNVFEIHLPPLRERQDDILRLTAAFLTESGASLGRPVSGLSADARPALLAYRWPGNVRELRNVIERATILADGGLVTRAHLNLPAGSSAASTREAVSPAPAAAAAAPTPPAARSEQVPLLSSVERQLLEQALQAYRYNKSAAARALGLTRTQLYYRLRKHGIA